MKTPQNSKQVKENREKLNNILTQEGYEDAFEDNYDKKDKEEYDVHKISISKEIKTKIKKLYMENQDMFQQNYISIQVQKVIHQTEMTLRSRLFIIILIIT